MLSRRRVLTHSPVVGATVLLGTGLLGGCVTTSEPPPITRTRTPGPAPTRASPSPRQPSAPTTKPPTTPTTKSTPRTNLRELARALDGLAEDRGARLAVAVAVGDRVTTIGHPHTGPAWSTSKVPLALAALAHRPGAVTEALVRRALRRSDNDAAEQLWALWPDATRAAKAVTTVLRRSGDRRTTVPRRRSRPGYSIFGQTTWRLADQARFGLALRSLAHGKAVTAEMAAVAQNQQWGLWDGDDEPATVVKGGWGPDPDGGYLVRQLAMVRDAPIPWSAALLAVPRSGQFTDGTAALSAVGRLLRSELEVTRN